MMNDHSAPLARAIDAQDRFASSGPKIDMVRHRFIHRNISTGPPDRRFNQVEVGLGAAGDVPRMAARTDEKIATPRRTGGGRLVPLLYGLAAFFMIAGSVPAASQPDSEGDQSWSAPSRLGLPSKAGPSRCQPTAAPPSRAGLRTTGSPERRGSTPAAAVSGPQFPPRSWDSELHLYRSASMGSRRSVRFGGQAIHSLPFRSSNGPARDSCAATNGHHYSMTSSARPSSVIGTLRPSALAFREFRAH